MAINDPTVGVPTPTGVLQGAAAFSWDGSAWQPAGRAGPSVATPTGVLLGVAPFTWSGGWWQPYPGRSGPGVPTPSGTLDGIALYNWNGTAWMPVGGGPGCPTPSGVLRGVAGFYWDGAAWQPASQAGPSVATPSGVLQGMAMFNATATGAVPAGSLDLNFMTPGVLDSRITFTRGSTATYFNSSGTMQTAATNAPRWDYDPVTHALRGLLIEEARTNVLLQSTAGVSPWVPFAITVAGPGATPNNTIAPDGTLTGTTIGFPAVSGGATSVWYQPFAASAVAYTFSIWLRGVIGGELTYISANTGTTYFTSPRITLTTQWQRYSVQFTATAATWVFFIGTDLRDATQASTPAQTVNAWGAQLEAGAFPTSYIPTAGATVTRALDDCWMPIGAWFNTTTSTLAGEFIYPRAIDSFAAHDLAVLGDNTPSGSHMTIRATDGGGPPLLAKVNTNLATLAPPGNPVIGAISRLVGAWSGTTTYACLNGAAVSTQGNTTPTGIVRLIFGNRNTGGTASPLDGYVRRVQYWPRVLSNAELQSVTT